MNRLFVPYDVAIELKHKGFTESCVARYNKKLTGHSIEIGETESAFGNLVSECTAPTYTQVINWLDNLGFLIEISIDKTSVFPKYNFEIIKYNQKDNTYTKVYSTYDNNVFYYHRNMLLDNAFTQCLNLINIK
jgi:hypothetical protein